METFTQIELNTSLSEGLRGINHAAHCMLWFLMTEEQKQQILAKESSKDFTSDAFALMQVRSDGLLGFPGGFIDEEIHGIDEIVQGLNRELKEEINCDGIITKNDYVFSDFMQQKNKKIILHFFVKKLSKEAFEEIELNSPKAIHYLSESLGVFRVPMKCKRFLKNFLKASNFCGNSRDQLVRSIEALTKNNEL